MKACDEAVDACGKLLFQQLEPTISTLLHALHDYKTTEKDEQEVHSSLQTQSLLLQKLQSILASVVNDMGMSTSFPSSIKSQSLAVLFQFVFLPINAVLNRQRIETSAALIRTAETQCLYHASRIVVTVTEYLSIQSYPNVAQEPLQATLGACVVALQDNSTISASSLDQQECCIVLLQGVSLLWKYSSLSDNSLLPPILDVLVGWIEPPSEKKKEVVSTVLQERALKTMQTILRRTTDSAKLWQSVFPGVYAALFRRVLASLPRAKTHAQVPVLALSSLVQLLQHCFPPRETKVSRDKPNVLEQLRALTIASNQSTEVNTIDSAKDTATESFLQLARQRLPSTLMVLLPLIMSAQTMAIRQQGAVLAQTVVSASLDNKDLNLVACETCLVLSQDKESCVANAISLERVLRDVNIPDCSSRLVQLLTQDLVTYWHALRATELQSTLRLILAYIKGLPVEILQPCFAMDWNTGWLSSLSLIQQSSTPLMQQEQRRDMLEALSTISKPNDNSILLCEPETVTNLVAEVLQLTATRVLGVKKVVVAIDGCISDLYESHAVRQQAHVLRLDGLEQAAWAQQWIGRVKLTTELLTGLSARRMKPKEQRFIRQLAESLLPLCLDSSLWDIPVVEMTQVEGSTDKEQLAVSRPSIPATLSTNANLLASLLCLTKRILASLPLDDLKRLLATILYSLLEKSTSKSASIAQNANSVLSIVSERLQLQDGLRELVSIYLRPVLGTMTSQLRVPGGGSHPVASLIDVEVRQVALVTTMIHRELGNATDKIDSGLFVELEELTRVIIDCFDKSSFHTQDSSLRDSSIFLSLLEASADHLLSRYLTSTEPDSVPSTEEQWMALMEPFLERHYRPFTVGTPKASPRESNRREFESSRKLLQRAKFASILIARGCYLLSNGDLTVQVESCCTLRSCFRFLGALAKMPIDPEGEEKEVNGPHTAILRQIHTSWPAISANVKGTTASLRAPYTSTLLTVEQQKLPPSLSIANSGSNAQNRVFLARLIELTAVMAECSEDFMARNFRSVVWASMSDVLSNYKQSSLLAASDVDLLQSIFSCIVRVFSCRDLSRSLHGLIPTIGYRLLFFLDAKKKEVVLSCIDCLQHLLRVDYDALTRPLTELAGLVLPQCPFDRSLDALQQQQPRKKCQASLYAQQLLDFIEKLPEQDIDM